VQIIANAKREKRTPPLIDAIITNEKELLEEVLSSSVIDLL